MEQKGFNEPFAGAKDDAEETINIRQYWHIILERRWLVIATFLLVNALTIIYLLNATSIFSATTRLQIDRETENALRMDSFLMEGAREQDYLQTQYKNLLSRTLMSEVLKETIINASILNAIANGQKSMEQLVQETQLSETNIIQRLMQISVAGFFGSEGYGGGEEVPDLITDLNQKPKTGLFVFPSKEENEASQVPSNDSLINLISGAVTVSPIRLSRLVDVIAQSPNPNEAAMIANTVIAKFLEQDNARKRGKLSNAISFLNSSNRLGSL
mgnify:FL=1